MAEKHKGRRFGFWQTHNLGGWVLIMLFLVAFFAYRG